MTFRMSLLVGVSLALWALDFGVAQNQSGTASAKLLDLENKWNAAYKHGDVQAMNSVLADDFIITVEDGTTYSKSGYIALNGNASVRVVISEMSDLKVRMHGNAAVVTGTYHEKGLTKGKPYEYHDRFTDVWMNINGKWQVIASHYGVPASDAH
jgi:ketosteroid isomerase-like protein